MNSGLYLYSTKRCPKCVELEQRLIASGREFAKINFEDSPEKFTELFDVIGARTTVPILYDWAAGEEVLDV